MHSHSPRPPSDFQPPHAPLWLAASEGRLLRRPVSGQLGKIDGPEALMEVQFFGITEAEQRAALAAFPGGKRFVLVGQA
jgi:hypothetical protein